MFSPDGTLISASAAPHCGRKNEDENSGKTDMTKEDLLAAVIHGHNLACTRLSTGESMIALGCQQKRP